MRQLAPAFALALAACGQAPAIELSLPEGPVRGEISPEILPMSEDGGWAPGWAARLDGAPITLPIDTTALADGAYTLEVYALGGALQRDGSPASAQLLVDNTPPTVSIADRSLSVDQGSVLAVFLSADEPGALSLTALGAERTLFPLGGGLRRALIGVPIRQAPGTTPLMIDAVDVAGNAASYSVDVEIRAVEWETGGRIRGVSMKNDSDAVKQMRAERDAAYAAEVPEQRWSGGMLWPTEGRISSPFGKYRSYPDGSRSHHDAVDITNRSGTPVYASSAGEALVAQRQAILGNAVILHHGQGVTTSYNHLSRIDVAVGQRVEAGEQVGLMGSTGRSTGPHLHWGMVVDGVAVDASAWPEDGFADPGPTRALPRADAPP